MSFVNFFVLSLLILQTLVESGFVFNKEAAINIQDGDFSEYVEVFNFSQANGPPIHFMSLTKYEKQLDNATTSFLYIQDEIWHLRLMFVPGKQYMVEVSRDVHFAVFNPIYSKKHAGWYKLRTSAKKSFEKSFMYNNNLIYNEDGDILDTYSIAEPDAYGNLTQGHFLNIKNISDFDSQELKKIREICFSNASNEYCVTNSTDAKHAIIVDNVPAIFHLNGISIYFIEDQDSNQYALKDHVTGKHYRFPSNLKRFKPTKGYLNPNIELRIPLLNNLNDPFFKKYR